MVGTSLRQRVGTEAGGEPETPNTGSSPRHEAVNEKTEVVVVLPPAPVWKSLQREGLKINVSNSG